MLGLVLRRATGRPVAEYLEEKIWQPIGAEADATWLIDRSGQEVTYCCLNAVLRDYARLGLLLAHDGNWRGRQLIPAGWVKDATSTHPQQRHLWPEVATPFLGYGYQVWLLPGEPRRFVFLGVRGQSIFVDPRRDRKSVGSLRPRNAASLGSRRGHPRELSRRYSLAIAGMTLAPISSIERVVVAWSMRDSCASSSR